MARSNSVFIKVSSPIHCDPLTPKEILRANSLISNFWEETSLKTCLVVGLICLLSNEYILSFKVYFSSSFTWFEKLHLYLFVVCNDWDFVF